MTIQIQLLPILKKYHLNKYGYQTLIGNEAKIPRKIIARLCNNQMASVSLDVLERLCIWLRQQHLPLDLPGALLAFAPSGLLGTLSVTGHVTIYLGEYREQLRADLVRSWVSLSDSQLSSVMIELLSGLNPADRAMTAEPGEPPPRNLRIDHVHVPSNDAAFEAGVARKKARGNLTADAERIFKSMRHIQAPIANIMIGSQRANFLVELFIAEMFRCEPFKENNGGDRIPFYMVKPDHAREQTQSSFGGTRPPVMGNTTTNEHGLWHRDHAGTWEFAPSRAGECDAGLVIIRRDRSLEQIDLAIFGVSGHATVSMQEILRHQPDQFWRKPEHLRDSIEVQMFVCKFRRRPDVTAAKLGATTAANSAWSYEVIQLCLNPREKTATKIRKAGSEKGNHR